jgi:hypothetical protein
MNGTQEFTHFIGQIAVSVFLFVVGTFIVLMVIGTLMEIWKK